MIENKLLSEIQSDIRAGKYRCLDLVEQYLANIESTRYLNIYVAVFAEEALNKARETDLKIEQGKHPGPLFGLICSIKDVLCYQDHPISAASMILQGYVTPYSATAVERLLESGAIIIGSVNCDEFAMGSTNEYSTYGPVRNGRNPDHISGGSSGGSAVSVQMNTCLISLGSDTGGSVRMPAGFCGVFGFKPSYGRISRYGLIAYASSFDQIGIIGKHPKDIAQVLSKIAGSDSHDSTCSTEKVDTYESHYAPTAPFKVAYLTPALEYKGLQSEIKNGMEDFIDKLKDLGIAVDGVGFDLLEYVVPAYYVLTMAEASSNLSRYDGVRYGYRSGEAREYEEIYTMSRTEGFGAEVKRRIMLGTFVLSEGYYNAYYEQAQKIRRMISDRLLGIFQQYDFLLLPSSPTTAWKIGDKQDDPVAVYMSDLYTVIANLAGIPAISIPIGQDEEGLDFGIQLHANHFEEHKLLHFSQIISNTISLNN